MKKVNNLVRGLLFAVLAVASVVFVFPGMASAADNESISLSGIDAHVILTNSGINYVSNLNSNNFLTVDVPAATSTPTTFVGDASYGLSFSNGHVFVAAGIYDSASTSGGLQVPGSAVYGKADTYTYSKVFAVNGSSVFTAFLDGLYVPSLEAVSYNGSDTFTHISDIALGGSPVADISALTVSGGYAFVGIQNNPSGGRVNIVNVGNPAAMTLAGMYTTSDAVTSLTVDGNILYVGHGNSVDVINVATPATPTLLSTVSVGAQVNGLTNDGINLFVANDNGLKVFKLSGLNLLGTYDTAKTATAVSVDGGYIYIATSNGANSEIIKLKMAVLALKGVNPQTVQLGSAYTELGATVDGANMPASGIDATGVDTSAVGSYTVTYTAKDSLGTPGLQITRTVNVKDNVGPVITVNLPNPQTIQVGSTYVELGATTNDGSPVTIDASAVNTAAVGSYTVTYNAVDGSGNAATQKTRKVDVVTTAWTITASTSGAGTGTINPTGAVVIANGNSQAFTMTPTPGSIVSDVLVDGVSVGAVYNYTFNNVVANHTIVADFELGTYHTITASANANGSISPAGSVFVNDGNSQSFTITANSGSHVVNVLVDGAPVGAVTSYAFTNVTADHDIVANFARNGGGGCSGCSGGGGSSGGGGATTFWEIPGCGMRTTGVSSISGISCVNNIPHEEVLGAEKFIFTLLLKRTTPPPFPRATAYVNEVMELQKFLNAHGFNSGLVDGKFGPITQSAVIRFQLANGLVGDGIVGPLTRAVLNR